MPMSGHRLELLGGFRLRGADGTMWPVTARKGQALLSFLALQAEQGCTRDRLAALLWEDSSDAHARQSLRQVLAELRRSLPGDPAIIETAGEDVGLRPDALSIDVIEFERLLDEAVPEHRQRAVALYRGELLEGFNPRAPAFEDWLTSERNRLRERMLTAIEALLRDELAAERSAGAMDHALRLLALDPLNEWAHRTLMELHVRQGHFGAALKQYRACQYTLRRELDVAPEAETEDLFRRIMQQRRQGGVARPAPAVAGAADTSPGPAAPGRDCADGPHARSWAHGAPGSGPLDQPRFVGRQREWRQCVAAIESCRDMDRGQSLLIRGEAGIGKSRLVDELATLARHLDLACHRVHVPNTPTGHEPVRDLVRSLLDLAPEDSVNAGRGAVQQALSEGLIDPDREAELHDLLELPMPAEIRNVFEATDDATRRERRQRLVAELVAASSRSRPRLLMLEDIHWADNVTLDHLARVAATVADWPVLLVMTHRIEGEALDPAWRGAMRGAPLTTIDLGPLRDEDLWTLATSVANAGTDDGYVGRCIERAGGNPWFLEQLLRAGADHESAIPDSLRALVRARLERLAPADRRAAQAASVLGQQFTAPALHHLLDDSAYDTVALIREHLLQPEGQCLRFAHDLIREGIHESLSAPQRRALHARAAEWFRGDDPALVAQHLDHADSPQAPSAYLEAASAQARACQYERALALANRGLERTGEDHDRYGLLHLKAEILHETGDIDAAIATYRRAAETAVDDEQRCRAWLGTAAGYGVKDRHDDALMALDRAEHFAGHQPQLLARLDTLRGNLLFPLGRIRECLRSHQRARKHAREAGSAELEARALSGLGDAAYLAARMSTAYGHFDRCVELAHAHGCARIEASNIPMRGITHFYQNDLEAARRDAGEGARLADRIAHARARILSRDVLLTVLYHRADWPEARRQAEEGLELARGLGAPRFQADYLLFLGLTLLGAGERATAERHLDRARTLSHETSPAFAGPWIHAALATATTDSAKRARALAEGERLLPGSVSHNVLHFHQLAIDLALEDADPAAARRHCTALAEYTRHEPLPWSDFFIDRGRALAAWHAGECRESVHAELKRLAAEAERSGLFVALPALRQALTDA